jgi:hypothetical protein
MKVEEIAEAVANLPPDQLARFRRWFTAFEAGRADHAGELDSAASKLGRFAGRAFAEMKGVRTTVSKQKTPPRLQAAQRIPSMHSAQPHRAYIRSPTFLDR